MIFILSLLLLLLSYNQSILASENIFGVHLTQPQDIYTAKDMINSSEGDWGWATIVIRTDQLNHQTWQDFFDNCRKFHIQPIIRLATVMEKECWKRPDYTDIDNLAIFLNSLNWPVREQPVILFNEINHAKEWGGEVDIKNYTDLAIYASKKFKELNPNFTILTNGLDLAAPENPPLNKSASNVYREIFLYRPEFFDSIDAIASHSYPNHGYIGTPKDSGQHSIRGYLWEQEFIKNLGIKKIYPIFITETGWPHRQGVKPDNGFFTAETATSFLNQAFSIWQSDPNIKAVTPFIYNYPHEPFDHFSWLSLDEKLMPEYQKLLDTPKNQNQPEQITKFHTQGIKLPFIIFTDTEYTGEIVLKNIGQSIWGEKGSFCLNPQTTPNVQLDAICIGNGFIYPNQSLPLSFKFKILSDKEFKGKTYISWENTDTYQITPFYSNATIYRSELRFKDKIINFVEKLIK
ncbi:MAG: hypothetical protein WC841_02365 [Candidatus Shapirobacteria bacterium]|jgi:hypothetical protein